LIVVGVDPGNSSGWSIWDREVLTFSAQGSIDDLVASVEEHVRSIDVLAVESIYPGRGLAGPKSLYTLGKNTGKVLGRLHYLLSPDSKTWEPTPQEWRSLIGIAVRNREKAASLALDYAEALSKKKMEGPRGGRQIDRSMAVCIGYAAIKRK
jgi:hypothetical protein